MNNSDITREIQRAMKLKHRGDIAQALVIEEECFRRCKEERGTTVVGRATIMKALGKLYYIDNQIEKAKAFFCAGIDLYLYLSQQENPVYEMDASNCAFYLGACSPEFLESAQAEQHRQGLTYGGAPAGQPGSGMTSETVDELTKVGARMFQEELNRNKSQSPAKRILG